MIVYDSILGITRPCRDRVVTAKFLEFYHSNFPGVCPLFAFAYITTILWASVSSLNCDCFFILPSALGSLGLAWLFASTHVQNKNHQCTEFIRSCGFSVALANFPRFDPTADLEIFVTSFSNFMILLDNWVHSGKFVRGFRFSYLYIAGVVDSTLVRHFSSSITDPLPRIYRTTKFLRYLQLLNKKRNYQIFKLMCNHHTFTPSNF